MHGRRLRAASRWDRVGDVSDVGGIRIVMMEMRVACSGQGSSLGEGPSLFCIYACFGPALD
jgi:hypothetical protein